MNLFYFSTLRDCPFILLAALMQLPPHFPPLGTGNAAPPHTHSVEVWEE